MGDTPVHDLPTEDALEELSCLQEKAEVALDCVLEDSRGRRTLVLADIASDYLVTMREILQAIQERILQAPGD